MNMSRPLECVKQMNMASDTGPDDEGVACFDVEAQTTAGVVVLGSTRLAIIDTSAAGHQPMQDSETGIWITYNGETYNFRELKKEIGNEFGPWQSNTDTEVVLRAYRKWGVDAFSKLRGMFALAIWDAAKQELILARDSFGIKPLYYTLSEGSMVADDESESTKQSVLLGFASEVRALLASNLVSRRLSPRGVASYLQYGSVEAPLTIVDSIFSLMPGQVIRASIKGSAITIKSTNLIAGSFQANSQTKPRQRNEAVAALRRAGRILKAHLVSDVPLGVFFRVVWTRVRSLP